MSVSLGGEAAMMYIWVAAAGIGSRRKMLLPRHTESVLVGQPVRVSTATLRHGSRQLVSSWSGSVPIATNRGVLEAGQGWGQMQSERLARSIGGVDASRIVSEV